MKRTRSQIKAELMKKIEAELEQLLDWQEQTDEPDLTQFEDAVMATRKEISVEMLKELLRGEQNRTPLEVHCAKCGQAMENKGKRPQVLETRLGTLRLERTYYHCPQCGKGLFPPG
jgi:uncharacterized protein with PIN domain